MAGDNPPTRTEYRVHDFLLEDAEAHRPNVHVLATGGTIANPIDDTGYLTMDEVLEDVPVIEQLVSLTHEEVAAVGSSGITHELWYALNRRIHELAEGANPPDGIVITHGSNTAEETAYFLNLTLNADIPVVITAGQRWHGMIGNDGDWNLVCAVRVAGHPDANGKGVMLVESDKIQGARETTKVVGGSTDAWDAGQSGCLGLTDKRGLIQFYSEPIRPHTAETEFDVLGEDPEDLPDVEIVYSFIGADGSMISAAVDNGADGIVLAGLPTGRPVKTQVAACEEAVEQGVPVVISHRGLHGWTSRIHLDKDASPYLWADNLRPQKARILLALGLRETDDFGALQELFLTY